jgi:hypothetical protein
VLCVHVFGVARAVVPAVVLVAGQRDILPNFPKFDETSDLAVMQDELSRYLVSLAVRPTLVVLLAECLTEADSQSHSLPDWLIRRLTH